MATPEEVQSLVQKVETLGKNIAAEGEAKRESNRLQKRGNRTLAAVGAALLALTLVVLSGVDDTKDVASDTNEIVRTDLDMSEENVYRLTWVLTQQAVPALTQMCQQLKALDQDCPTVILNPEQAPPQEEP